LSQQLYGRFSVEVALMRFGQPERRYLRRLAHLYNTRADYQYLAQALSAV
jgi:hypothetical protein